jgi:hypothetical protein
MLLQPYLAWAKSSSRSSGSNGHQVNIGSNHLGLYWMADESEYGSNELAVKNILFLKSLRDHERSIEAEGAAMSTIWKIFCVSNESLSTTDT